MSRSYVCVQFPEVIGDCERCGLVDHHLVEGLCPTCRPKTVTVGETANAPSLARGPRLDPIGDQVTVKCTPGLSARSAAALNQMATAALRALKGMAREEGVPLGAEASVSHVRVPKGRAR